MITNIKQQLIPKLRFPDYSEVWEEKSLGKIAHFFKGKGVSKSDIIESGRNKCIRYGELYTVYNEVITEVLSSTNLNTKKSVLSIHGDLLIPSSGETPLDIAKASCIKKEGVILGGDINIVRLKNDNASFFAYYITNCKKMDIARYAQGISVIHLYNSNLKKLKVLVPSNEEQQKIASFLSSVDYWIDNLEKQKESLKEYKKGTVQKIFSQEVRFEDENGREFPNWQEVRLDKVLIKHNEKTTRNDQYPVLTSSQRGIFFQKDYFSGNDIASKDTTGYNVVPRGFFTYRHMSDTLVFKFNINTIADKGIVSTLYPVFTTKKSIDDKFLLLKLNEGNEFKKFALMNKQGGSRTYMYYSKLKKLVVELPCLEEQRKIMRFLGTLDKLIDSKNKQVKKAKEWKKGLLQQMFV